MYTTIYKEACIENTLLYIKTRLQVTLRDTCQAKTGLPNFLSLSLSPPPQTLPNFLSLSQRSCFNPFSLISPAVTSPIPFTTPRPLFYLRCLTDKCSLFLWCLYFFRLIRYFLLVSSSVAPLSVVDTSTVAREIIQAVYPYDTDGAQQLRIL